MFGHRFFGTRFFAPRYFPPVTITPVVTGGLANYIEIGTQQKQVALLSKRFIRKIGG